MRLRASDDTGATSVEYALMVAMIAIAIAGSVGLLGLRVAEIFERPCQELTIALSRISFPHLFGHVGDGVAVHMPARPLRLCYV